jgi:hypothetical protein
MKKKNSWIFPALALGVSLFLPALPAFAQAQAQPESGSLAQDLRSGFYSRINLFGFGIHQELRESTLNPGNALRIPRDTVELDFRPDFNLNLGRFEFGLKPRFQLARNRTEVGAAGATTETSDRAFINEGFVRYRATDQLLAIVGRENLQWGPSALLSPSNPFNVDNGKNNPYVEQPGLDFARVVVIPNSALTMSLIANTGAGRLRDSTPYQINPLPATPFRKAYALKLDYTGDGHFISLIGSHREQERNRLGFFGGWNVSDALILYTEGSAAKKNRTVSDRSDYDILAGGAYTLEAGPTISLEYFRRNAGCVLSPIELCLAQQVDDPSRALLRTRYALLQYVDTKIGGNLNLALRLIRNLDDSSNQFVANLEYEVGRNWQLYFVPAVLKGSRDSEFGSLLRYSAFVGASYTF